MPTTALTSYSNLIVQPAFNAEDLLELPVRLKVSTTFAAGTVIGEITATPGTYGPYVSTNTDGTQNPAGILRYPCTTDASGNISMGGEFGVTQLTAPMAYAGDFYTADLVGLDANAVTKLSGHLIEGSVTSGIVHFG